MIPDIVCTSCGVEKSSTAFGNAKLGKWGKKSICHECKRQQSKEYRKNSREKVLEYQARTREATKFTLSRRNTYVETTYGISAKQYAEMYEAQQGCCKICKKHIKLYRQSYDDAPKDAANIDHNHITGQVRALLCGDCNRGLGLFKDNIVALRNAVEYLESHGEIK